MSVHLSSIWSVLTDTASIRYYVAGTSDTLNNQHIHVLKGSSTDIWASTWSYESMFCFTILRVCSRIYTTAISSSYSHTQSRRMGN
jgi:hypothetical protein